MWLFVLGFVSFPIVMAVGVGVILFCVGRWQRELDAREGVIEDKP